LFDWKRNPGVDPAVVRSILPNEIRETVKLRGVMRFLADAGLSRKTVEFLRLRGHDAVHVRDLLLQRAADRDLVDKARADSRTVLTFDLDFGEILALGILKQPSVVIFRLTDVCCYEMSGTHPATARMSTARCIRRRKVKPNLR
jgi:predicted nuclease of predicted toxin-antitoxin system